MEDIIKLNVGGRIFMTKRRTLCACPDSMLGRMFEPDSEFAKPAEIDGCVFLDRDPEMFGHILNYLRSKRFFFLKMNSFDLHQLMNEADYFGFIELREELLACSEKIEVEENWKERKFNLIKDDLYSIKSRLEGNGARLEGIGQSLRSSAGEAICEIASKYIKVRLQNMNR